MDTTEIIPIEVPSLYDGNLPENYEQKCPVILLLDVSGSMIGRPIDELNMGLQVFEKEIQGDAVTSARLDLAIVTFESKADIEHDFGIMEGYGMPYLKAGGRTNLEEGFRLAMKVLEERKSWYRSTQQTFYRPYIILITDGKPDIDPSKTGLTASIKEAVMSKSFNFWPIGVECSNMDLLDTMACPEIKGSLPAQKLAGLNFVKLFKWLSGSLTKISKSHGKGVDIRPEPSKNPFMFTVD